MSVAWRTNFDGPSYFLLVTGHGTIAYFDPCYLHYNNSYNIKDNRQYLYTFVHLAKVGQKNILLTKSNCNCYTNLLFIHVQVQKDIKTVCFNARHKIKSKTALIIEIS
jgi:SET domain-containing protein